MNPYQVLGLPNNATIAECKTAYRKLSAIHHPDNKGDEVKFYSIQSAWLSIKDSKNKPVILVKNTKTTIKFKSIFTFEFVY